MLKERDFIEKYGEKLAGFISSEENRERVLSLVEELLSHICDVCVECESDRIKCAFKPICGSNRPFLNVMVDLGMKLEDLPQYCLQQRTNLIKRYLHGKIKYLSLKDAKIPLKLLLETIPKDRSLPLFVPKNPKELIDVLKDEFKRNFEEVTITPDEGDEKFLLKVPEKIMFAGVDGKLLYLDLENGTATINPLNDPIDSEAKLRLLIRHLAKVSNLDVDIIEEMYGFWYLNFLLGDECTGLGKEVIDSLKYYITTLDPYSDYVTYRLDGTKLYLLVDVKPPGKSPLGKAIKMKTLNKIFEVVQEAWQALEQASKEKESKGKEPKEKKPKNKKSKDAGSKNTESKSRKTKGKTTLVKKSTN
ncbi:MAG: hypothetical protein ACFE7E_03065 [Candidatus Hodarchaeota archaeon]